MPKAKERESERSETQVRGPALRDKIIESQEMGEEERAANQGRDQLKPDHSNFQKK